MVADTTQPRLVWEVPYYPAYYFPVEDVRTDLLVPTATVSHSPSRGDAQHFTIKAGSREAEDAALRYVDSPVEELRDLVRLDWDAMDGWFEEDEEVYTHPRDPYTRVDILATSRRVRAELDGVVLADSTNARVFCAAFFDAYNHEHRHAALGLHTPASVYYGTAPQIRAHRAIVLDRAYAANPQRFARPPTPPKLPTVAWINQPTPEALIQTR